MTTKLRNLTKRFEADVSKRLSLQQELQPATPSLNINVLSDGNVTSLLPRHSIVRPTDF